MGAIYQYLNKINGHMYIGLAVDPQRRYREHCRAAFNPKHAEYNYSIHRAIRKYGLKNFDFIILEDNLPKEKLKEREIYWINHYNTYKDRQHYNDTPGGDMPGEKSRHIGEEHGMAKLTEQIVIACRKDYAAGLHSREVYNELPKGLITYRGFLRMWHGKTWRHIMPEVFKNNPHPGKYTAHDRDVIVQRYKNSGLTLSQFLKTTGCYVGYGTAYKMIHYPEFYDNK